MESMNNKVKAALSAVYVLLGIWIMCFQFHNVWGNLEASFLWATPPFVFGVIHIKKHITKEAHAHCAEHCSHNKDDNDS
jgi:hypothetical protein